MAKPECSLWINVARTDAAFFEQTVTHLVKVCNFPFTEKVLAVDTKPLQSYHLASPNVGTLDNLLEACNKLLKEGIVTRVVEIDYSRDNISRIYKKYFDSRIFKDTHSGGGFPILGFICNEDVKGDYLLHFDSDIIMYQEEGYSWIEEGIKLLQKYPEEIMSVHPLCAPQRSDSSVYEDGMKSKDIDKRDFYRGKFISNQVYLINIKRFEKLLPIKFLWYFPNITILNLLPLHLKTLIHYITGKGELKYYEEMVSKSLERSKYYAICMASPKAWTIHPKRHDNEFIRALPRIISQVENGVFPKAQAGYRNIKLESWLE